MRVNARALFGGSIPWTCAQCATKTQPKTAKRAFNSTRDIKIIRRRKPVKSIYLAAASTVGAGAGALAFSDHIKHGYEAAERSGRVLGCLAVNINE